MADLYPADRLATAQQAAAQAGLDALLLTPGADLRYLTGYDAKPLERLTCLVLPTRGDPVLVVPRLERAAAQASPASGLGIEIATHEETDDAYALVAGILGVPGSIGQPGSIGLANRMWAEQVLRFAAAMPDVKADVAGPALRQLRMRKSAEEVDALRRAGDAIDRVHNRMGEWLRAGRTEAEVGHDIADAILAEGHAQVNFVIVGSGPNGASPHHELSDRLILDGDPVVVDIGGSMPDGYCSDCTRTYAVGEPPGEFRDYYAVLREAQQAACEAVRPGVTPQAVDAAARDIITAAGYGPQFIHRTGHGIGLEEHEDPYIVLGNTEPLQAGNAFSIEPGIYLEDSHGARIEDIVVVTADGHTNLDPGCTRDLVVLDA